MKNVVSLCDKSGIMVQPWAAAGFECWCVDIQHSIRRDLTCGNIHYVWGDVRSWCPPKRPSIIFGFPPCTHLAVSGARDFEKKSWPMLRDGMDLFWSVFMSAVWAGVPYMIENPVGRIAGIHGPCQHTFHPWQYGDGYDKRTCLWTGGGFIMPEPTVNIRPVDTDQRIWTCPPSDERSNIRSETPKGFAMAVFNANRAAIEKGEA